MHRRLALILLVVFCYSLNAFAQQPVASPPVEQIAPPQPHRHDPPGGRQPLDQDQTRTVTNADVIKMVKGGVPASAIISSIRTASATKFDLSAAALIGLRKDGVDQKIIDAMKTEGSVRRGEASAKIKLGPPKTGPKVKNPRAAQADAAIVVVLQKQRQAADAAAAQMKMGIRPVGQTGLPVVQSQSASGFTDPNKSGSPAAQSQAKSSSSGNKATATMPSTVQKAATPGMIGPGKPSDASGNSPSSTLVHATQLPTTVLTCTQDPTMRILNVGGEFYPATFTQDAKYNFYTIAGCSFGDPGPNSKVDIYYQDSFHQEFQVQEWNDNGIKLNLDPNLKGLLDHDNLTLVVQRADGKQATKAGYKFYAARETKRLEYIPRSSFSLNNFTLNKTSNLSVQYTSPSSASMVQGIGRTTAEVVWTDSTNGWNHTPDPQPGEDIYQFKQLQPGFEADSAQMVAADLDCGSDMTLIRNGGTFGLKWVGDDLHASWQAQYCKPVSCGGMFQADCFSPLPGSYYAVDVWVTGPRGVDPWTGEPN